MQFRTTGILLVGAMALPVPGAAHRPCQPRRRLLPDSGRCYQAAQPDRHATLFQSRECHSAARREEQRVSSRRYPLPNVGIDRGVARWRDQNAQCRRGAIHRQRKDSCANSGHRGAVDFTPLLVSAADLNRPAEAPPAAVKELYRTVQPITDLKPGSYDLNLTRVTFPAQMPSIIDQARRSTTHSSSVRR
jgi:hypothetical protein